MANSAGVGERASTLDISTSDPRVPEGPGAWPSMTRSASRAARNAGVAFRARVPSQAASDSSWAGPSPSGRPLAPATAYRASIREQARLTVAKAASAAASSRRSATANGSPRAWHWSRSRSITHTWAPSEVNRRAASAAIPVAPVTTHTFPASRVMRAAPAPWPGWRPRCGP